MSQIAPAHLQSLIVLSNQKKPIYLVTLTRHCASNNFYIEYSKLTTTITSFVKSGVKVWNSIPNDVRELGRRNFNLEVQKSLLIFEIEDDYVDVPTLIKYMRKAVAHDGK